MKRFFRWFISLFKPRFWGRGLLILALLLGFFYAEENWRGARAWQKIKAELEKKGESLDSARFIPPMVASADNFCAIPLLDFQRPEAVAKIKSLDFRNVYAQAKGLRAFPRSWAAGRATDYAGWREHLASDPTFPADLKTGEPTGALYQMMHQLHVVEWQELKVATERRQSRFLINYDFQPPWEIPLPHLTACLKLFDVLSLRASIALASGHETEGLDDLKVGWKLAQALAEEPLVISQLVNISGLNLMLQPIWEGLGDRRFQMRDLEMLRQQLAEIQLLENYQRTMRGEFVRFFLSMTEYLKRTGPRTWEKLFQLSEGEVSGIGPNALLFTAIPSGWLDQNRVAASEYFYNYLIPVVEMEKRQVFPVKMKEAEESLRRDSEKFQPSRVLARLAVFGLTGVIKKTANLQANLDLAGLACALEIYFLKNHSYPESLDKLERRLPRDVMNGQPYHYQKTSDGRYRLWSVGWNLTDEGGRRVFREGKPDRLDEAKGDWVWDYEAQ
jgi:hypothetical protein